MIKRIFAATLVILNIFTVVCFAKTESSATLQLPKEFYTYSEDKAELSGILGLDVKELDSYVFENNLVELAANEDNTKQIKYICYADSFSTKIGNISSLADDKIEALIPDIVDVENAKGKIIKSNGQKFIKCDFSSNDNGGEYIITQYITVVNNKFHILNFLTATGEDTEYSVSVFEDFSENEIFTYKEASRTKKSTTGILISIILISLISVAIIVTVVIDFKRQKNVKTEELDK